MHVLLITPDYPPEITCGVGNHVETFVGGLLEYGSKATIVVVRVSDQPQALRLVNQERITVCFGAIPESIQGKSFFAALYSIMDQLFYDVVNILQEQKDVPQLIHCHTCTLYPLAQQLRQYFSVPVITTPYYLHEPFVWWTGSSPPRHIVDLECKVFQESDRVILFRRSLLEEINGYYPVDEKRVRVIPNGYSFDNCPERWSLAQRELERSDIVPPSTERVVLFAGRITPEKGVHALLKSAVIVTDYMPGTIYLIAGKKAQSTYSSFLQEFVDKHPALKQRVKFLGHLSRPDLDRMYRITDLIVIPSISEWFLPYTAKEAMSHGVPVVGTMIGGVMECLQDRGNSLLVKVSENSHGFREVDANGLAAAQIELLGNESFAQLLGKSGQEALAAYSIRETISETLAIYEDVFTGCVSKQSAGVPY